MTKSYDRAADREALLTAVLDHVPFDGWSESAFQIGAKDAGISIERALNAFPGGMAEVLAFYHESADRWMIEALLREPLADMKIREKIAKAVRLRLEQNFAHREAVRSGCSFLLMPQHAPLAAKLLYRTVDAIWYAIGDRSTDFNFYTKRGLLAAVYSATVLYWINDKSPNCASTWSFLDRRIAEVMQVPKAIAGLTKFAERLPDPTKVFRRRWRARNARG
jgi:ubiquinone biosynthesis protein COQ9